jgi:hypothetical protein
VENKSYQSSGLIASGSGIMADSVSSQPIGILADSSAISLGSVSSQSKPKIYYQKIMNKI